MASSHTKYDLGLRPLCVTLDCDHPPTAEGFTSATLHADRVHGPALLFDWFCLGRLHRGDMAAVVCDVWTRAERPQGNLGLGMWVMFFEMAGYPKPAGPLTVYRGATLGRARGMSWTTDLEKARWFAGRFAQDTRFRPAYVYAVEAPPEAVLADVDALQGDGGRWEGEIVVNPHRLPKVRRL